MLTIDDWRGMYEAQEQDLIKLRARREADAIEIAALRADAERYRYIRQQGKAFRLNYAMVELVMPDVVAEVQGEGKPTDATFDAAIDAAMKGGE